MRWPLRLDVIRLLQTSVHLGNNLELGMQAVFRIETRLFTWWTRSRKLVVPGKKLGPSITTRTPETSKDTEGGI